MSTLTKVFVVLQLLCSLVLAVLLVLLVSQQDRYKSQVELAEKGRLAAQAALTLTTNKLEVSEAQVAKLTSDRTKEVADWSRKVEDLNGKLASLQTEIDVANGKNGSQQDSIKALTESVNSLKEQLKAKDEELAKIRPEIVRLIAANSELNRVNNELTTQLKFAETAIRKLQEALQVQSEKMGAVTPVTGTDVKVVQAVVQTPVQIDGKVATVTTENGKTYVKLGLGARDGVKMNAQFAIYRGNVFVADAQISRVTADESIALVTVLKPGQAVQAGDLAVSGSAP